MKNTRLSSSQKRDKTFDCLVFSVLFGLVIFPSHAETWIEILPNSINTTMASEYVTVHCSAHNANGTLKFLVNGKIPENSEFPECFSQSNVKTLNGIKHSNLKIKVDPKVNNTKIKCIAIGVMVPPSNPVFLRIQGALGPPTVTNTTIINDTAVSITWEAPPTLEGTIINGYYISSTSGDSLYTEDTSKTLPITNPDPCGHVNISIIPYNGISGTAFLLEKVILPSVPNDTVFVYVNGNRSHLTIQVNVSELCPGEYPDSVLVNITNSTGSSVFSTIENLQGTEDMLEANISIHIAPDQNYSVRITPKNAAGDFKSTEWDLLQFDGKVVIQPKPNDDEDPTFLIFIILTSTIACIIIACLATATICISCKYKRQHCLKNIKEATSRSSEHSEQPLDLVESSVGGSFELVNQSDEKSRTDLTTGAITCSKREGEEELGYPKPIAQAYN